MPTPLPKTKLNETQLRQFRDEGYVILGRVLSDEQLEGLRGEEARFRANAQVGKDQKNQTLFFSQVGPYSQIVRQVGLEGAHLDALEQLIGPNLMLWYTQFVTKMPDGESGKSEFPWHQDNGYISIEPANNVTVWIALDDVDTRNGCVWVDPKSHLQGLLPHKKKSADSWFLEIKVAGDGVPAVLKAGEAVAFTGLTLHRSKLNHTDRPRRAFFFEYCDPASVAVSLVDHSGDPASAPRSPVIRRAGTWLARGQLPLPPNNKFEA
ncbi:phytanoyl-CoA dioxygenase family protein [Opitutus sp. GAS368]|jgi:phytanoyl-CoA hydroxylase|uniref:phytanoyl-CoA dioxygenase family protein n=1 Tax=Opitutus sp. GAS368 TaxID=1882749 RepID=UPI00087CD118|nr:phytanoyl-CoA dioxygenase family protein [Opitutus sp. GAS368]SDS18519.1 Phytanoyl-CoA dioxygenase (PhyH) [Opitutus sp. GAS368]